MPTPEGAEGLLLGWLLSAAAIWIIVFSWRFAYAPVHFRLLPHGGLAGYLKAKLGGLMGPFVVMLAGIVAFVMLFGGGALWFMLSWPKQAATVSPKPGFQSTPSQLEVQRLKLSSFSQSDKNRIGDVLFELSQDLGMLNKQLVETTNRVGGSISEIQNAVNHPNAAIKADALLASTGQLEAFSQEAIKTLYGDKGFLEKHKTYADELNIVEADTPNSSLSKFRVAVGNLAGVAQSLKLSEKYKDRPLEITLVGNTYLPYQRLQEQTESVFSWFRGMQAKIKTIRSSLN